jgi:peptidoglycan-associated lipoprotein
MRRITVLLPLALGLLLGGCGHHSRGPATVGVDPTTQQPSSADSSSPVAAEEPKSTASSFMWRDVRFGFDDSRLSDEARKILAEAGAYMLKNGSRVEVQGHCDERGSVEYNLALGERRAMAAKEYLVRYGIPGVRITTISLGKERPLDQGHDEAAWARNRRAHFLEETLNP